jgi:hypothetical protein
MSGGRKGALDVRPSTLGAQAAAGGPRMARRARMGSGSPRDRRHPRLSVFCDEQGGAGT